MTAALFAEDQETNDRLLLNEAQRRRDLIDQAVSSFAPHLANTPGVEVIHLHSTNASLRKALRITFEGSRVILVEHVLNGGKARKGVNEVPDENSPILLTLPPRADIVVTKSGLNSKVEWLAARLGALPLVLPEGENYLRSRLKASGALVLVGADQA